MAVTKRLRYEVLRRDNHTCRYCGKVAGETELRVDHVVPVALGGSDRPANLVAACQDCNAGKAASNPDAPLIETVADDALRWAAAMQLATERAAADRTVRYAAASAVYDAWQAEMSRSAWMADDWERSVNLWTAAGLSIADLLEAVSIAANKYGIANGERWRYFCGVCHGMLRQRVAEAQAIIAEETVGAGEAADPSAEVQDAYSDGWEMGYMRAERVHEAAIHGYLALSQVCDGAVLAGAGL